MRVKELGRNFELYNPEKIAEAEKHPNQSKLGLRISASSHSTRKRLFKRPPIIVEGDEFGIKFLIYNRGEKDFPGGQLFLTIGYGSGQEVSTSLIVPSITIGGTIGPEVFVSIAMSPGMAFVHASGLTKNGQRILLYDHETNRYIWDEKVAIFMIWPIAAVYSSWAILLAGIAVAVSVLSLILSISNL